MAEDKTKQIRALRRAHGLSQGEFWGRLGITQSAGSRYESGRSIPAPTKTLVALVYGDEPLDVLTELRQTSFAALLRTRDNRK